jgi:nucleoside-diphosphate-sugar epimerase
MPASIKIAVARATGRVGSRVVELLEAGGHDVVPIARSTGMDVVTGEGLAEALTGAECVSLLPHPHAILAGPTFEEWLDSDDANTMADGPR